MMTTDVLSGVWPEWQIEQLLGRGSFGAVYRAVRRDHNVQSYAAIKVISIPQDASEVDSLRSEGLNLNATRTYLQGIVNDFVSEIQLMESLKGTQNIVSVEDYKVVEKTGEIGWNIYIRMELLTPFNTYLRDRQLTEQQVIKLGCDICTALEICGKRNIIHRDIKPENIFLNDFGYFKLGDFGIARKLENMTGGLSQKGTYNYMAPEVANGREYDARVDIYSLGIVLYRLLNGNRLPFLDNAQQLMNPNARRTAVDRRLRGDPLPPPCNASPAMADLVLRACAYRPEDRFATATEMKQALLSVANGSYRITGAGRSGTVGVRKPDGNRSTGRQQIDTFAKPRKKSKLPVLLGVAAIFLALVAAGLFLAVQLYTGSRSGGGSGSGVASSGTSASLPPEEGDFTRDEQEEISAILESARQLADGGDYAAALAKVQTGLVRYPASTQLQAKADEYTAARDDQLKNDALTDAAAKANSGDYPGAIDALDQAITTVGEDADLAAKRQEYADSYTADVVSQTNTLLDEGKYSEANGVLSSALQQLPGNSTLLAQQRNIQSATPQLFLSVCPPYQSDRRCGTHTDSDSFTMGGELYHDGITMEIFEGGSWFLANLNKQYAELSFALGHVDNTGMTDVTLTVYLDGVLYNTYTVVSSALPQQVTIPVTGVSQLRITANYNDYNGYPTIGLGNMTVKADPNATSTAPTPDPEAKALVQVCPPYELERHSAMHTDTDTVNMAGQQYRNSITMEIFEGGSWFLTNLKGQYSEIQFDLGHVDGTGMTDVTLSVYLDDVLYTSYTVGCYSLPQHITLPVTGATQLRITAAYTEYNGYPTICLGNITIK